MCETDAGSLPCAVGAEADAVKSATQFGLVLRVALQVAQFVKAVRKLAFVSVFAFASFFVGTAQFRLVAEAKKEVSVCHIDPFGSVTYRDVLV